MLPADLLLGLFYARNKTTIKAHRRRSSSHVIATKELNIVREGGLFTEDDMLMLARVTLGILVAVTVLIVQYVDGNQNIVQISEDGSDNKSCCAFGICYCHSLDHALISLTNNVIINITNDTMLSSLIEISNLRNVSIIGHNNPTVNCKNVGGIHVTFCQNCIVQGIIWDGCGSIKTQQPGLKFKNSYNVTIHNCSFKYSVGQAVVLSEVSGDVIINHCKFLNNTHYRSHGSVIHYSFEKETFYQSVFMINDCNFTYNEWAKSLVYIENNTSKHNNTIRLNHSKFCHNQGVPVYVVNQNIFLSGQVLFLYNTAENGAGIYMTDHSNVVFGKDADVTFIQNIVNGNDSGTIFSRNQSSIIFDQNSEVTFNGNRFVTIYSEANSNVIFKANCRVTFRGKSSMNRKISAIYSLDNSHITFAGMQIIYNLKACMQLRM